MSRVLGWAVLVVFMTKSGYCQETDVGLFPLVFNLATGANIITNATCGGAGPENYCRLVEHVRYQQTNYAPQCGVCDAKSWDWRDRHPVTHAIDGSNNWWQSPSIATGVHYNWVTITLDLRQVYHVAYIIVKAANSPRPGNWILEHSIDGQTYMPWQYYAMSDSECETVYGVEASVGVPRIVRDDQVLCSSHFSRLDPLQGGEIHTSLINGRPGANGPSQELQEFTSARYVRLRLQRIRTLNADLMTFLSNDPIYIDSSVTNRYFYSIKDISIGGQCICYGHARLCPTNDATGESQCECEKNTCGRSCETCCPLYNQKPWKPGTYTESNECEECNCFGHAIECVYNATVERQRLSLNIYGEYDGGGVCLDCADHTTGLNCEQCVEGYYRQPGVDLRDPHACRPCECDVIGSTGDCVKDDCLNHEGLCAGDCICEEAYTGPRCEVCALGFTGYPHCQECPCSRAGSLNVDTCDIECMCKAHVCGDFCDECAPGFYNLQASNPDGCHPCYCFGASMQCHSSTWGRTQLTSLDHWMITDLLGSGQIMPVHDETGLQIQTWQTRDLDRVIYWSAPPEFLSSKLISYGGILEYSFRFEIDEFASDEDLMNGHLANDDVIIQGGGVHLGFNGQYYPHATDNLVRMNMSEGEWRHLEGSNGDTESPVPREEFLNLLAGLEMLMIKATYHTHQTEARLLRVSMDVGSEHGSGEPMSGVEVCECPEGYAGTSCESCALGFRRVDNILYGGTCERCECNSHSDSCNPYTGECIDCQHNTQGAQCELCDLKYVGDATRGTMYDCTICACPLAIESNSFAEGCVADNNVPNRDVVCINCDIGYEGTSCERCMQGYYGDPMVPGGNCQPCDCHGNSDPNELEVCDTVTGRCTRCVGHTEGDHCERCVSGYHGTAVNGDCRLCSCDPYGSLDDLCDPVSGQCQCRERYTGSNCDSCQPGFGDINAGCMPCDCDGMGSVSQECDGMSGQCPCKPGVGGHRCDSCLEGYWQYSENGCFSCHCHETGSVGASCDPVTGHCQCRPFVAGATCSMCQANYWNLTSGYGCEPCGCDLVGSRDDGCDEMTGQCHCQPGVTGRMCDRCQPGYYQLTSLGCLECSPCSNPGHVCDPVTGECVCPPNTEGQVCERCIEGSWGHDPLIGCKPCSCDMLGAIDRQCDLFNGECICKIGFTGMNCDQCEFGHFGFPNCRACGCDPAGTESCNAEGICSCNDDGQCPCKENVHRRKCITCAYGSFSLTDENPKGCTDCFCFGRSHQCEQAERMWQQLTLSDRSVEFTQEETAHLLEPTSRGFLSLPESVAQVYVHRMYHRQPIYWALPQDILGDMTSSYAGVFQFKISAYARNVATTAPLLHLVGNHLHLVYPMPGGLVNGSTYSIIFHEESWHDIGRSEPTSRERLMTALQNVQTLLVYCSEASNSTLAWLSDISLSYAVPAGVGYTDAYGVEQCQCPSEYEGLSCQNPAPGYYREHPNPGNVTGDVWDLIGISVPCQCHGHAATCDPETGTCLACEHGTAGRHCEVCQDGYYGNAENGTPEDCAPCACPLFNSDNNFSPTCVPSAQGDYICDACPPQYTGRHCQRCAAGYYGTPVMHGAVCQPCACSPYGSQSAENCDPITGQCSCLAGITGRACDQCSETYALVNGECVSCLEGCTGMLMADVDDLLTSIEGAEHNTDVLLPWHFLMRMENETEVLQALIQNVQQSNLNEIKEDLPGLKVDGQLARDRAGELTVESEGLATQAGEIRELLRPIPSELDEVQEEVEDVVADLEEIAAGSQSNSANTDQLVREAERILRNIRYANYIERAISAEEELRLATILMEQSEALSLRTTNTSRVEGHINRVLSNLNEMLVLARVASNQSEKANNLNRNNKDMLYALKSEQGLVSRVSAIEEQFQNMRDQVEEASHLLWNISTKNYRACEDGLEELLHHKAALREKSGLLAQNLPESKQLLDEALLYAEELYEVATQLEEQFEVTRESANDSLRAVQAYDEMTGAIQEADGAAIEASRAAERALDEMSPAGGEPFPVRAEQSLQRSQKLETQAQEIKDRLGSQLEEPQQYLDDAEEMNRDSRRGLRRINQTLDNLPSDVSRRARAVNYRLDQALTKAQAADETVSKYENAINDELATIRALHINATTAMRSVNNSVNSLTDVVDRTMNLTEVLAVQAENINKIHEDLSASLEELRNNIKQARQQANNIKIAMRSDGNCVRRYEPEVEPSVSTSLSLMFKTNRTGSNLLLAFLGEEGEDEFMSLEVVDGHVRFAWNIGGGPKVITHYTEIQAENQLPIPDEAWYKVNAERFGNFGRLRVQHFSDMDEPDVGVNGTSSTTHTRFDLGSESPLYIGGVPDTLEIPREVLGRHFAGCVGEVKLNGEHIGLYNFRELEGHCQGCGYVPMPFPQTGIYQFGDEAQAVVGEPPRFRPSHLYVELSFKTFWKDQLLFLWDNKDEGDFASLYLRDGRVVFAMSFGLGSYFTMRTEDRYNTNKWITVSINWRRNRGMASLVVSVNDDVAERREADVLSTADGLLDLGDYDIHIAGVPPGYDISSYSVPQVPFLGCMKSLQVGTFIQNLLHGSFANMEVGCHDQFATSAGFPGDGFLQLPGHDLSNPGGEGWSITFSFRTTQQEALLMLGTDGVQGQFYSISLRNGQPEAWFNAGQETVIQHIQETVNDGHMHVISLTLKNRRLDFYLDDHPVGQKRMRSGSRITRMSALYIGGVPGDVDASQMAASTASLQGCISDVIIIDGDQGGLVTLDTPEDFSNADVGRCVVDRMIPGLVEDTPQPPPTMEGSTFYPSFTVTVTEPSTTPWPTTTLSPGANTQEPMACAELGPYGYIDGAVTFGDVKNSHAEIVIERKQVNKDFNITVHMRTLYKEGLMFYITNEFQTEFIAAQLSQGRVVVSYDDSGIMKDMMVPDELDDGLWHRILILKNRRKIVLQVDNGDTTEGRITRRVDVIAPLYVGGLPSIFRPRDGIVSESFKGCMKGFYLNDHYIDLVNSKAVMGVRQCYSKFEHGVHFDGYGFALFEDEHEISLDWQVQFEFKTTRETGVLLSTSDIYGYPALGLEMYEGRLRFTVVTLSEEILRVESDTCRHCLCDNQWHSVEAIMSYGQLSLLVDERPLQTANGPDKPLETFYELFMGGFPSTEQLSQMGPRPVHSLPQAAVTTGEFFQGCFRNFYLNYEMVSWHSISRLHDVHVADCPVS